MLNYTIFTTYKNERLMRIIAQGMEFECLKFLHFT